MKPVNKSKHRNEADLSVEIFLTRSLGLGTGELRPDGFSDILSHQGVLGLNLGEGVGHGEVAEGWCGTESGERFEIVAKKW